MQITASAEDCVYAQKALEECFGLLRKKSKKQYDYLIIEQVLRNPATGNLEPVSDYGKDGHSIFAYYFLQELNKIEDPTTGDQLYNKIKHKIKLNADQTPIYEILKRVGSEGGDFIFVKNNNTK